MTDAERNLYKGYMRRCRTGHWPEDWPTSFPSPTNEASGWSLSEDMVSESRVSQLHTAALRTLRRPLTPEAHV